MKTKKEYFEVIKEVTQSLRENNLSFRRVFSEARPTMNGYKTKVWGIDNPKKAIKLLNKKFGDKLSIEVYESKSEGRCNIKSNSLKIVPKERIEYLKKEDLNSYIKQNNIKFVSAPDYGNKNYEIWNKLKKDLGITTIEYNQLIK